MFILKKTTDVNDEYNCSLEISNIFNNTSLYDD